MDSSSLRHMKTHELSLHLRHVSGQQSVRTISIQLLNLIESETLPPTVFNVLLTSVKSCPLKDALWQRHSRHVRYVAIRRFGKNLKGVHWEDAWQEVGETEGLLDLFSQMSVLEVKKLSEAIGRCPGRSSVINCVERQRRVTELVQCLLGPLYPSSPYQSKDQRPLNGHYAKMIPACTSEFIESLLRHQSLHLLQSLNKSLVQNHSELLLRLLFNTISREDSLEGVAADRTLDFIPHLLQHTPSAPTVEPRFSASMSLAVAILERIVTEKQARFPGQIFMSLLIVPLVRRLRAHKVDPSRVRQIIQLAVKYLQRHKQVLSPDEGGLLCYVAKYWSSSPTLFEDCLIDLIGLLHCDLQRGLSYYKDLIQQAEKAQRYDLLRIVCLHNAAFQVDIDSGDGLKDTKIRTWPIFIFMMLRRDHSLTLLKRLIRLKPKTEFLELDSGCTIFSQAGSPGSMHGDIDLLITRLQTTGEVAVHEAHTKNIETLKSIASKSREQTDRAFFAKSAAFHAIASEDLTLYGNIVQWTRRFLRDAMTVKMVYSPDATNTVEGIALLSGIPEDLGPWNCAGVRMRITKANSIMLDLLDAAVTSLREPFFWAQDWNAPLYLFQKVVMSRMSSANRLKRCFQLSEDETFDTLWSETINMLLQAEEIGLKYKGLGFNSPYGPLAFHSMTESVAKPASPSFYRFLDNLARSRDGLWRRFRPTGNPAVAALEPPWPRGLPIHCLMGPINVAVDSALTHTPFIADRAAEVVFADPAIVLVEIADNKETRRAVGQFVDSFNTALAIYILQCPSGDEQDNRVHAAWAHAIKTLSRGQDATALHARRTSFDRTLSENEAELFWEHVFKQAVPQMKTLRSIKMNEDYPIVPTEFDPQEPSEWNPAAIKPPDFESRKLPVTILDCMIATPSGSQWDSNGDFFLPTPRTQGISFTPIWSYERLKNLRKLSKPVQEGMIATALLIVSSKIEGSKTLASPFPSGFDVRYPSLFLDHEFLLSWDGLVPPADIALSYFIKIVPSTLLLDLAASALDTLSRLASDSTNFVSIERSAYRLLMLLSESDRPQLASDLIIRTILNFPDASSWHRRLLSKSLVRTISAEQAQDMMSLFASSILETLKLQATSSSNSKKDGGSDSSSKHHIKVTTVKFLAQFLNDVDFVGPEFCVDILSRLFQNSSHVDIRVAVLDSIFSKLGRCADEFSNALAEKLMSVLETAIPVLGSLNERKMTQDVEWTEAEKTGKLPEVYVDMEMQAMYLREVPPMLRSILVAASGRLILSDPLRKGLIHRVLLPAVKESARNCARWIKIFTLKHFPAVRSFHLPSLPVKPGMLGYLIQNCSSEVQKYILDLYQQFVLINISPPAELIKFNNEIKDDVRLCHSNEGRFWLSLYDRGTDIQTGAVVHMLAKPWKPSAVSDGIQIQQVQEIVFEQAETLLKLGDVSFKRWDRFMLSLLVLQNPQSQSDQDRKAWLANAKPVLLRIITRIDALRTPAWQRDRCRQPAVLPPTFGLRLQLLDYPQPCSSSDDYAVFAQQLVSALQEVLNLGLAHRTKVDEVEAALWRCLPEDIIRLACYLGNIEPEDPERSQENMLRVELTDKALRRAQQNLSQRSIANKQLYAVKNWQDGDKVLQSIRTMLEGWRKSELEEIRMREFRLGNDGVCDKPTCR